MALTQQQIDAVRQQIGYTPTSQNSAAAEVARRRQLAAEYDAQQEQQRQQQQPGFVDRVSEDLKKRAASVVDTAKQTFTGKVQGTPFDLTNPGTEAGLQVMGQAAGAVNDVIGEGFKSAAGAIAPLVPDKVKQIGINLLQSPLGQAGLSAIKQGAEAYDAWSKNNPRAAKDLESVVNIASLFPTGKGAGLVKEGVETGAESMARGVAEAGKEIAKIGAESPLVRGGIQTATEIAERVPRTINRLKEGAQAASEKATKISMSEPVVAQALKSNLDNRIINTISEADDATRKAYKQVVDIAEESPKTIGIKKQPSIVSGELATKQFEIINKEKSKVGQEIGKKIKELSKTATVNMSDGIKKMDKILEDQGIFTLIDEKGVRLDFSSTKFTPAERARIKELYNLAVEGGFKLSPNQVKLKDQLFSKLQRESRMEGVGDLIIETPEGNRSLFSVFRDIYSSKLDTISPEIKKLNQQYRQLSLITEDIEDSIFRTPNFNIVKTADPSEFAKVNLRRIFGESQSSPVFEAIADKMDSFARKLGYDGASPKKIAEFAQELRKLYPETVPKTGFTGGIRMGLTELLDRAVTAGAPNLMDQRKALVDLLEHYLNPNKLNLK